MVVVVVPMMFVVIGGGRPAGLQEGHQGKTPRKPYRQACQASSVTSGPQIRFAAFVASDRTLNRTLWPSLRTPTHEAR